MIKNVANEMSVVSGEATDVSNIHHGPVSDVLNVLTVSELSPDKVLEVARENGRMSDTNIEKGCDNMSVSNDAVEVV